MWWTAVEFFCGPPPTQRGGLMRIQIRLDRQELDLFGADGALIRRYSVSTARNGPGELNGSGRTPRGHHVIRAVIGRGAPQGTVFKGRRPTGEVWSPALAAAHPEKDWILSRILWLSGLEPGRNRLGKVDSMRRYIYIHGTGDDQPMGVPLSRSEEHTSELQSPLNLVCRLL